MDKQPVRVLIDTNVYDFLATVNPEFVLKIIASKHIKVYGCRVIRNELRNTPVYKMTGSKKLRVQMLNTYDLLAGKHDLPVSDLATFLASEYLNSFTGNLSREKLLNDFLIVAVASLKGLDIICTGDEKTMASNNAKEAYKKVNQKNALRTPKFIQLEELKNLL